MAGGRRRERYPLIKNPYTFISPDRKHEYFVYRSPTTDSYYIMDDSGKTTEPQTFIRGYHSAEEAQKGLERMAKERGWVRLADVL